MNDEDRRPWKHVNVNEYKRMPMLQYGEELPEDIESDGTGLSASITEHAFHVAVMFVVCREALSQLQRFRQERVWEV